MIADLKPYPEYKESGLPWLGEVPGHWHTRRAKFLLREVDERSSSGKEQLLRVSQYTGVTQRMAAEGSDSPDTRAASLVGYKIVRPDDLVVNIMLAWNGSMGVSRYSGITSPAYCVYRFNADALPWYFHELLRTPAYKQRIKNASTGVVESRLRLYSDDLGRLELPLPPVDEQAAIGGFLDWANGRLERAIRAKRKVIVLLNEQKQAIIHRAVTRGLDPSVPLKPSGVPWLGDIPANWETHPLKRFARVQGGFAFRSDRFVETGIPLVRMSNLKAGRLDLERAARVTVTDCSPRFALQPGDLLYGMSGSIGNFGLVTPEDVPCQLNQRVGRFVTLPRRMLSEYLCLLVQMPEFTGQVSSLSTGTAQMNVSPQDIERVWISAPPEHEQRAICDGIDSRMAPFAIAISRLEREIDLLREYRTRLVADVVTGKLDVREAAARLPEDSAVEPSDDDAELDDEPETEEAAA